MPTYLMRVSGLGEVYALFLDSAVTEADSRRDAEKVLRSDKRVKLLALLRITALDITEDTKSKTLDTVTTYLLTGVVKETQTAYTMQSFFGAMSDGRAKACARNRALKDAKLFRCMRV
jgi:hypothetical protein